MKFKLVEEHESKKDFQDALEEKGFEVKYIGQGDYVVSMDYDDIDGVVVKEYDGGYRAVIDEDKYVDYFFEDLNDALDVEEDEFVFNGRIVKVDEDSIDVIDNIEVGKSEYDTFYREHYYEVDGYVRVSAILTIEE